MAGQTKVIIITSDEDIIRRFADVQNQNPSMTSIETNMNNTNKRAIDATDHTHQSNSNKTRKKSTDLICTICADRAIGYNYAVLSCASCKAFFHRHGQEDLVGLLVLVSTGFYVDLF